MKWKKVKLGDLFQIKHGWAFKGEYFSNEGELIIVTPGNFFEKGGFRQLAGKEKFYLGEFPDEFLLKKNDVIIAMTEQGPGLLGSPAIVPSDEKYLHNQRIGLIHEIKNDRIDPMYIYWLFFTSNVRNEIFGSATGTKVKHTAPKRIYDIDVNIPHLPTQRKIASILSAYDDLIENNLKRIKLLEEKAAIAYREEFGNYQVNNKEFASLPKGWNVKTIGDIYGKLESGSRPKGGIDNELKEGIASVGAENVIGLGKYNYQSEKLISQAFFENMNRGIIKDRDILIYKDGAYIGKTSLFQDGFPHEKCCVNEHVFLLSSQDVRYQYFLFFTLNQGLYFEKMQQLNANAAQPGINQESLKSLKLIWPSEDKIDEFNKEVESSVKLIFVLAKQNTKLREARDILLPKLMSGQIEV